MKTTDSCGTMTLSRLSSWIALAWVACVGLSASPAAAQQLCSELSNPGGCAVFGPSLGPIRPRLAFGGHFQTYERGEVARIDAVSATVLGLGEFAIGAHRSNDGNIRVDWTYLGSREFNKILLRWDVDDHVDNVQTQHADDDEEKPSDRKPGHQIELDHGGAKGTHTFGSARGTFVIYVKGCDVTTVLGFVVSRDCGPWSPPVYLDVLPELITQTPFVLPGGSVVTLQHPSPFAPQPAPTAGPGVYLDEGDPASMSTPFQALPLLQEWCNRATNKDGDDPLRPELHTQHIFARLELAKAGVSCTADGVKNKPDAMLDAVRQAIAKAEVKSVPGTNLDLPAWVGGIVGGVVGFLAALLLFAHPAFSLLALLPSLVLSTLIGIVTGSLSVALFHKHGDYDFALVDLVRIAYLHEAALGPTAYDRVLDELLTVNGAANERKDVFWLLGMPTPAPESENHIWMTESARYLTNKLLVRRYLARGQAVPKEFDNTKNGMANWMLKELRRVVMQDMYELNSRPYAPYSFNALSNLADLAPMYAGTCLATDPGSSVDCDVARAARNALDFLSAKFAVSSNAGRRAVPFRRQPPFRDFTRLWTNGADDMTWRMFAYTGGSPTFVEQRRLQLMETSLGMLAQAHFNLYRPPVLITDILRHGQEGSPALQRGHSTRRDGELVEVYYRDPKFLISAGGRHDRGRGFANWLANGFDLSFGEDGWALPTTLMPTKEGDDYRDFVRILGNAEEEDRENTCVAPGFACGVNPRLPVGLPRECRLEKGNWTFIDFDANTPQCPFQQGFYVAFYQAQCATSECRDVAGNGFGSPTFGFFEAVPARNFQAYVDEVLMLNDSWSYEFNKVNVYKSPFYGSTTFMFMHEELEWPIVEYGPTGAGIKPERRIQKWPVVDGAPMSSPEKGCVLIDNPRLSMRLVIDHTDWRKPRRAVLSIPRRDCGCPLVDACLNPRAR